MDCFHFYVIVLRKGPLILKIDEAPCGPPQSFAVCRKHSPAVLKARQNDDVVLSSASVWIKTQLLHKDEKIFHCQRSEPMGSWIPLRELKSDSCHRQFLAHCFQWKVVCWFRGVTPKSPYKSSREGVSQEPLHFSDGKFSTLLYSEGVRHWLFSWPAPPGFPAGSLLPMIPAGTVLPD